VGDVEFLKERALQFLEITKAAAERGFYELALFHAEQTLQLYTKYLIYKLGDFPTTHFLQDLLDKVLELYGAVCNLDDFLRRPSAVLALPEHAYITSRCLPFRARREDYEVAHDALFYMESSIPCGTRCSVLTTSASRE
jgi:HEPN domain-containing protein